MVTRITDDYTNDDARAFDPALRQLAPAVAQFLFKEARANLSDDSTFENVEFCTECSQGGLPHGPECQIRLVTVRRRNDGPNGNDVVSAFPQKIGARLMAQIIRVHNLAYAR